MMSFFAAIAVWFGNNPWMVPIALQVALSLVAAGLKWLFATPRLHGLALALEGIGLDRQKIMTGIVMIWNGKHPEAKLEVPAPDKSQNGVDHG